MDKLSQGLSKALLCLVDGHALIFPVCLSLVASFDVLIRYTYHFFAVDRSPGEMSHTCRGTIKLAGALITTGSDSYTFTISSRGTHTFHLKASAEIERQKWVTALELAKSRAVRAEESSGIGRKKTLLLVLRFHFDETKLRAQMRRR